MSQVRSRGARSSQPDGPRRRRRSGAGLFISLLVHAVIFLAIFSSLEGGSVTGGAGDPDGQVAVIPISLAGLKGGHRQSAPTQTDQLQALFDRIRNEQSTMSASDKPKTPTGSVEKLFDVLEPPTKVVDAGAGGEGHAQVDQGGTGATANPNATVQADRSAKGSGAHPVAGPGSAASAGVLWGQIEPCWAKLPAVSTVPVTLEVSLNDKGLIAVPPKIIRPSAGAPDEMRLIAEARALAAVTACVPYHPAALSGSVRVFRVDFKASS